MSVPSEIPTVAEAFWSIPAAQILSLLRGSPQGLTTEEVQRRIAVYGTNRLAPPRRSGRLWLLLAQYRSSIILILIFAAVLSTVLHDFADAVIILSIVAVSGLLGFWQEAHAAGAVERLLDLVEVKSTVLRDGREQEISTDEIVPGDLLILSAGASVPADSLLLEAKDVFVDEATLTGETYPAEKATGPLPADLPLAQRRNALFMGTHVISGMARAVVVRTGRQTEFGRISARLGTRPPETEFERGLRRFGYFLLEVTLLLVIGIFAVNTYFHRPVLEAFLFSLALAVGLTPQLLPAIVSVNLAHGAEEMAKEKVIVKRLSSIENFGSMNLLCSDKTGTLTEGKVRADAALDAQGQPNDKVLLYAYLNASFETGFTNPIDEAIRESGKRDITAYTKVDEVPYDFIRKRLSILVSVGGKNVMISKGAVPNMLQVCSKVELADGSPMDISAARDQITQLCEDLGRKGFRAIGVAFRDFGGDTSITTDHEAEMTFLGLLTFFDPVKPDLLQTVGDLRRLGVTLKVITGDSRYVAANLCGQIGLEGHEVLTGPELQRIRDEALVPRADRAQVFAEVEPNQKERIVLALKKAGNVVGFLGDGVNDASALHAADVGISVDDAVDVAKEAADIVLLEKDLKVLLNGVKAGRKTFANTLKYVFMATSANFGNMFSMAGVSLFLPFLPMLPKQILLMNLLTDFPEMAIAGDSVDPESVDRPHRWDIGFIRRFMVTFGLLSSVFDYLTFGTLLLVLHADAVHLRTGWFMESVISEALIVLVIRSRRPFYRSAPGRYLVLATLGSVIATLLLPWIPLGRLFGFAPLPLSYVVLLYLIIMLYVVAAESVKRIFYRKTAS
jgi:P-type Mg2+ transporter